MSEKKKKYYTIKISRTELCLWIIGGIFALFWMFVLGVLVGQEMIYLPKVPQIRLSFFKKHSLKMLSHKSESEAIPAKTIQLSKKSSLHKSESVIQLKSTPKSKSVTSPLTSPQKKISSGKKMTAAKFKEKQYTIQIGSFKKKDNATSLQNKLKGQGYRVFIKKAKINAQTYYRVYVGPYPLKEALNFYADLSSQNYRPAKPTPVP